LCSPLQFVPNDASDPHVEKRVIEGYQNVRFFLQIGFRDNFVIGLELSVSSEPSAQGTLAALKVW
jgi:hypothetical protein